MSFDNLTDPEVITAISTGVVTVIAAIGVAIAKYRKNKKIDFEGCTDIITKSMTLITYLKNTLTKKKKKPK
jgi:hypothetical protein